MVPTVLEATVGSLIRIEDGEWHEPFIIQVITLEKEEDIIKIQLSSAPCSDVLIWLHNREGTLTVKSDYHHLRSREAPIVRPLEAMEIRREEICMAIWNVKVTLKVKAFMWKLVSYSLGTRSNLVQIDMNINLGCPFCNELESRQHLIFRCAGTRTLWVDNLMIMHENSRVVTIEE